MLSFKALDAMLRHMKECVAARDKLGKFMQKLDTTDPEVMV